MYMKFERDGAVMRLVRTSRVGYFLRSSAFGHVWCLVGDAFRWTFRPIRRPRVRVILRGMGEIEDERMRAQETTR